jgi:hypothetical protein
MADYATALKKQDPAGDKDPLVQHAQRVQKYVQKAEIDRNRHISRIQDCYKYGMPWRHKADQTQPPNQIDEIFDEELATVLEDFCADMLNTFTPQKAEWVEPKPVETITDSGDLNMLAGPLAKFKAVVFAEMARSNLYQALQEAYYDLGPGTMCLIVTDIDPAQPIHCEAIPAPDLLLNRGPYGRVDGTWRKMQRCGGDIFVLWPNAYAYEGKPWTADDDKDYEVVDGVYRDHTNRADEAWCYTVLCNGKVIWKQEYKGQGSNPFIVARWSRDATTAWGMGPTYRTLPATKTLNHFRYLSLKNYDKEVDPTTSYESDGVMNLDHGIEPGTWVPRSPGSKAPEVIESKSRMDVAVFGIDEVRTAIRRAHYQDRPEQQGKTPPTATQWADEAAERARRMGTPATNLVIELQYPLFRRFAYLLEKRGKLPKVKLNGETIALEPISPLLRAQEQEEVVRVDKWAEMIGARLGPEMANVVIDGMAYAQWLARKMGVPPGLARDPDQLQQTIQQLGPILGGGGMDYNPEAGGPPQQAAA